ncbi:hypothetical protein BDY19DRAFT_1091375 [Irpex rosettiformis]|uniref:Uncharacterized protein n=1 Tax=Irpex rosettiformis TaxID=378272 RepID=A0ACB8U0I3_9APHY|nr:hypothetical protein BDY19DRAFT_1091375 [Irpex rosettiformis]
MICFFYLHLPLGSNRTASSAWSSVSCALNAARTVASALLISSAAHARCAVKTPLLFPGPAYVSTPPTLTSESSSPALPASAALIVMSSSQVDDLATPLPLPISPL